MADIVLSTLNAKYIHPAFGLRYLLANLGELRARAVLAECDIAQRPLDIVERLLAHAPRIVGFGVYVWNVAPLTEVVTLLKRLRPDIAVILGGPEVSFQQDAPPVAGLADLVIGGEADLAFPAACRAMLAGNPLAEKFIAAEPVRLEDVALPYEDYDDRDIAHRLVYVEASRGCPFGCEFCLSSLDVPVRQFALPAFLVAMDRLFERGVRHFKFVDRTFNLNLRASRQILEFFRQRQRDGLSLHFEMIPDRLPPELRALLADFPAGAVQLEVGIQTFNPEVAHRIQRQQDNAVATENLRFLREQTGVHLHADLIVGLPGETLASFGDGFDRLVELRPHEIQVGVLKRLRGTPIGRHDAEWGMVYSPLPPYEILATADLDFPLLQRLRRFARYWDLVGNSGNFVETTPLLWAGGRRPFAAFLAFSDWLYAQAGQQHAIALPRLVRFLHHYLTQELGLEADAVTLALGRDYRRGGHGEDLMFLRPEPEGERSAATSGRAGRRRQWRHRGSG